MNRFVLFSILVLTVFITGCIGGKSVESSYLKVGGFSYNKACEKVRSNLPKIAVKRFLSLPALDRETVIIAEGQVLKPDYRWSWEGTPAEIFDHTAGSALNCMNRYEVVTPYRPGVDRDLILSGDIMSFELQRNGEDIFNVAVRYFLWDSSGKRLVARKLVEASSPVESVNGQGIAVAAQEAVDSVMNKTIVWLEGLEIEDLSQTTGR